KKIPWTQRTIHELKKRNIEDHRTGVVDAQKGSLWVLAQAKQERRFGPHPQAFNTMRHRDCARDAHQQRQPTKNTFYAESIGRPEAKESRIDAEQYLAQFIEESATEIV